MIIKTRKYQLPTRTYIKIGFLNTMRKQWWVNILLLCLAGGLFSIGYTKTMILALVGHLLYILFWFLQFYAVTMMKEGKMLFQPFYYHISSKEIMMQTTDKRGMRIEWKQIKALRKRKQAIILFIDQGNFIHLPYRIFKAPQEIKFFELILQRKGLIK